MWRGGEGGDGVGSGCLRMGAGAASQWLRAGDGLERGEWRSSVRCGVERRGAAASLLSRTSRSATGNLQPHAAALQAGAGVGTPGRSAERRERELTEPPTNPQQLHQQRCVGSAALGPREVSIERPGGHAKVDAQPKRPFARSQQSRSPHRA